jgi:hypothetical protein
MRNRPAPPGHLRPVSKEKMSCSWPYPRKYLIGHVRTGLPLSPTWWALSTHPQPRSPSQPLLTCALCAAKLNVRKVDDEIRWFARVLSKNAEDEVCQHTHTSFQQAKAAGAAISSGQKPNTHSDRVQGIGPQRHGLVCCCVGWLGPLPTSPCCPWRHETSMAAQV